jgi:hypothetical protein
LAPLIGRIATAPMCIRLAITRTIDSEAAICQYRILGDHFSDFRAVYFYHISFQTYFLRLNAGGINK